MVNLTDVQCIPSLAGTTLKAADASTGATRFFKYKNTTTNQWVSFDTIVADAQGLLHKNTVDGEKIYHQLVVDDGTLVSVYINYDGTLELLRSFYL